MARVTLQTIADRLGVSRMTVSNAFSRPDQLSAPLRARILSTADELGYTGPDPAARALARGRTGTVGVLLFDSLDIAFTDEVAINFLGSIATALRPTGYALTLLTSAPTTAGPFPARDAAMDGAIVYSCDQESPGLDWLRKRRIPLVLVDQAPGPDHPHVDIDDRGGARVAARHLLELGHRRIAVLSFTLTGPDGAVPTVFDLATGRVSGQRVAGWMDVLGPAGIDPIAAQHTVRSPTVNPATVAALFDRPDPPTAVLCYSDAAAQGIITALSDRGLRVPQDVSVVGFDDSPLAQRTRPRLTTVRQDLVAKGRAAVAALVAQLDGHGAPADVVLPTELVVRDSTGRPRDQGLRATTP